MSCNNLPNYASLVKYPISIRAVHRRTLLVSSATHTHTHTHTHAHTHAQALFPHSPPRICQTRSRSVRACGRRRNGRSSLFCPAARAWLYVLLAFSSPWSRLYSLERYAHGVILRNTHWLNSIGVYLHTLSCLFTHALIVILPYYTAACFAMEQTKVWHELQFNLWQHRWEKLSGQVGGFGLVGEEYKEAKRNEHMKICSIMVEESEDDLKYCWRVWKVSVCY